MFCGMTHRIVIALFAGAVLLPPVPAAAMEEGPVPPALAADGWRLLKTSDAPVARFALAEDGTVRVVAEGAVGFLARPVETAPGRRLSWRWRVEAAAPATDLRAKGADDRPAAVHVFFPRAEGERGLFGRIGDSLRAAAVGDAFAGRVITYVWGGTEPPGTRFPNPFMREDGALIVLRGPEAPTGAWVTECVDPAADHRAAFGRDATVPNWIALSADTDDRGGRSETVFTVPAFITPDPHGDCP